MRKVFQSFNNRTNSWVKMKKLDNGQVRILKVKRRSSTKKYKGVPLRVKK